ncbi:hypothetical protein GCM10011309_23440 [Litorimonas cladophorae]|uniref:YggT family protein n=1 Tax=Litorimonas cladophorae TaxID=1220491 RepID=A0A918KQW7_9PROT|nr:YggT family protein [Litorimonas cladophorae]GGX72417.1 hypothetical protein GCM10011309_23440 [Litorimonas cladophorae]
MSIAASILSFFVAPILSLILFVFLIYVIMSWLFMLNIVSPNNPTARQVYGLLSSIVEPIVSPFRKIIPPLGNLDLAFFFAAMTLYWISGYVLPRLIATLG